MKPIIAAYDDHEHAGRALHWAADIAAVMDAPLHVVSVFEPAYSEFAAEPYDDAIEQRRNSIRRDLDLVGSRDATIAVIESNTPIAAISTYAHDNDALLIAVGAHGRGGLGGLGDTRPAQYLLQHAHVPVAVIHEQAPQLTDSTIVIGFDGSSANRVAVDFVRSLVEQTNGGVEAVFAFDDHDEPFRNPEFWDAQNKDIRRRADAVGLELSTTTGHPVPVLIERAGEVGASAIVVGTRGHGGFDQLVVGNVPTHLIAHSELPVIVVPHTTHQRP